MKELTKTKRHPLSPAQKAALTGLLAAVSLILSWLERIVCALLPLPPGIRLGLSQLAVMVSLISLGYPFSLSIQIVKAGFALLMSGVYAGCISLCGGLLSVSVACLLIRRFSHRFSYLGVSIVSAVLHNTGQLIAASLLAGGAVYLYYAPALLLSGLLFGAVTGTILNAILPTILKRLPIREARANQKGENVP